MNAKRLAKVIIADLKNVASAGPNERLPKEEQIRCTVFNYLKPNSEIICAEKGFKSIDLKGRKECDLWLKSKNGDISWIEIKRAWVASGFVIHPDQVDSWNKDLKKLSTQSLSDRYFILVGVFDAPPLGSLLKFDGKERRKIIKKIRTFARNQRVAKEPARFHWRDESLSHIGVWIWHWPKGVKIGKI